MLKNADSTAKDYIENFIHDFLCISNETLETLEADFEVVQRVPIEKSHTVKSCHKSEKNKSQVIDKNLDCENFFDMIKGKSKTFYKKFWFVFRYTKKWVDLKKYLAHKVLHKAPHKARYKNHKCIIHVMYQQNRIMK